jgi:hypothetical protein
MLLLSKYLVNLNLKIICATWIYVPLLEYYLYFGLLLWIKMYLDLF